MNTTAEPVGRAIERQSPPVLAANKRRRGEPLMWAGLITLCVIAAAAAIRRLFALAYPPQNVPAQFANLDAIFADKRVLTLLHIVPALALVTLVPFQFSRTFRARHLRAHRWIGRTIMSLGVVVGISAFLLLENPVGGATEVSSIIFFDCLFLWALLKAFLHIRRGEVALHREWVIRAMSVALGVATVRPIIGMFFATARLTGMTPHDFFGSAFWAGFTLTFMGGELWIRYTRRAASDPLSLNS